jgi:hypothetical protein
MLDYRAHKLFWLILLPLRVAGRTIFYLTVAASIVAAQLTSYSPLAKIPIAFVAWELMSWVLIGVIWAAVCRVVANAFFWMVDVMPAHGANVDEARAIVLTGRAFELAKKFDREIQNWTYDDTLEFVSIMNWRPRLFFPVRDRIERLVPELQRIYEETGKQPGDLGQDGVSKIRESLPGGGVSWFEKAMVSQPIFNSMVALVVITVVFGYLSWTP